MKWVKVNKAELISKSFENTCGCLLVSDGKNLGYMTQHEIKQIKENIDLGFEDDPYINKIRDYTSRQMCQSDIRYYFPIPKLSKDEQ